MKTSIKLSAILLALTLTSWAAEPSASATKAVLDAKEAWKTALFKVDRAALEQLLSPDLSYTHSSSKTQTKGEFIQDVTSGTTVYKSIEFENIKLRQYGNTVIATQTAMITTTPTGTTHLYITEVWVKQGGRWQMATRLATKIPQT